LKNEDFYAGFERKLRKKNFIPGGGGWAASSPNKFILVQKRGVREFSE